MKKRIVTLFLTLINLLLFISVAAAQNADKVEKIVGINCLMFTYEPEKPACFKN